MNKIAVCCFAFVCAAFFPLSGEEQHGWDVKDWLGSQLEEEEKTIKNTLEDAVKNATEKLVGTMFDQTHRSDSFYVNEPEGSKHSLNEEIDRFFSKFNRSDPKNAVPIEVEFLGGKNGFSSPLLSGEPSGVSIPSFSRENLPVDYIEGALEAAKGEKMDHALRSASNGPVYRYLIGLESTSPLLASAIKQIQTWANQLNAMSINSYEMAAALVPGMWPKAQRGAQYACEHALIASGDAKNWIDAKYQCQEKKIRDEVLERMSKENPKMFVGSFNVAEKVFSLMGLDADKQNLLLNLTGSVVSEKGDRIIYYPPLHRKVLDFFQTGRQIPDGYRINKHSIHVQPVGMEWVETFEKTKIWTLLKSIQNKLTSDSELSEDEKKFLGSCHFPVGTFVTLMTQYKGNGSALILERYSELLAFERIVQFFEEIVKTVLRKAESLRVVQIAGGELEAYIEQVRDVFEDLKTLKEENDRKIVCEKEALDSLFEMDRALRAKMSDR